MPETTHILINRAPVLTLWMSIIARKEGHSMDDSLRAGRAIASMIARAKGQGLGIFEKTNKNRKSVDDGKRVMIAGFLLREEMLSKVGKPEKIQRYLRQNFGENLELVVDKMQTLADHLNDVDNSFKVYEMFRPGVPEGIAGWGMKGRLDLRTLDRLDAEMRRHEDRKYKPKSKWR